MCVVGDNKYKKWDCLCSVCVNNKYTIVVLCVCHCVCVCVCVWVWVWCVGTNNTAKDVIKCGSILCSVNVVCVGSKTKIQESECATIIALCCGVCDNP